MRHALVAALFALALAGAAQARGDWKDDLTPGDWVRTTASSNDLAVLFYKPSPAPPGEHRIIVRLEVAPDHEEKFHSSTDLMQVDCAAMRYRRIEAVAYVGNNLSGAEAFRYPAQTDWSEAKSGTTIFDLLTKVCQTV